jgi:hypothetical protein
MRGLRNQGKNGLKFSVLGNNDHLGSRDTDVPDTKLRNLEDPFNHREGFLLNQIPSLRGSEQLQKILAIFRLTRNKMR